MRIGVLTTWNVSCGISVHAELVARNWIEEGHQVFVLAPHELRRRLNRKDDPFVKRCFVLPQDRGQIATLDHSCIFNEEPFRSDYDVFVVEGLGVMPMAELWKLWSRVREKAKTVNVIHEAYTPPAPIFGRFDFDAVVCFDKRYEEAFLTSLYSRNLIHVIPFPCHPIDVGSKEEARRELGLQPEDRVIFSYGLGVFRNIHLLPTMERLSKDYPIVFLVVTEVEDWHTLFESLKSRYDFIELRKGPIPVEELYKYLHASDLLLIHRDWGRGVGISSAIHMCLGALCPILVHDTNFVEYFNGEVIKYSTGELSRRIGDVFERRGYVLGVLEKAKEFVERNSSEIIAEKFLRLFQAL